MLPPPTLAHSERETTRLNLISTQMGASYCRMVLDSFLVMKINLQLISKIKLYMIEMIG